MGQKYCVSYLELSIHINLDIIQPGYVQDRIDMVRGRLENDFPPLTTLFECFEYGRRIVDGTITARVDNAAAPTRVRCTLA